MWAFPCLKLYLSGSILNFDDYSAEWSEVLQAFTLVRQWKHKKHENRLQRTLSSSGSGKSIKVISVLPYHQL